VGMLEGEVAIVTGGGSGIGRAVVERFVEEGAHVVVADIDADRAEDVSSSLGDSVLAVQADVTVYEDNERTVAEAVRAFGKLDAFVANAGMGDGFTEFVDIDPPGVAAAYREIFDLNILGVLLGARAALPELARTRGSFTVTLSNSSFYPDGGGVMYIASKHGALGIVRQLAHELAPVIRVNGVAPGATRTDIRLPMAFGTDGSGGRIRAHTHPSNSDPEVERVTPLRAHADPADHAGAYVLVTSRRDGRMMTGSVVETDAGLGVRGLRRVRGGDGLLARLGIDEGVANR
jgi:2,3-dihydroxy-2,3-dihydrophenylpropionate dehydrogenase